MEQRYSENIYNLEGDGVINVSGYVDIEEIYEATLLRRIREEVELDPLSPSNGV